MQKEKASKIDFESFAEEQVDLEEEECKRGFARLKSSQIVESQDVDGVDFAEEYLVFNCVLKGGESGVVSVNKRGELYEFLLNFTDSDAHSELAGKYIPVDKVSDGVYKPAKIYKSCITDPGLHQLGITLKQAVDICVSLEFTRFNVRSEMWETNVDEDFLPIIIFIYCRKLISSGLGAIVSSMIVFPVIMTTMPSLFTYIFSLPRIEGFSILGLLFIIFTLILYKVLTASESYLRDK